MKDDAVVVLLIPGLQVDTSFVISIGFDEPDNFGVMFQRWLHFEHTERTMSWAKNTRLYVNDGCSSPRTLLAPFRAHGANNVLGEEHPSLTYSLLKSKLDFYS